MDLRVYKNFLDEMKSVAVITTRQSEILYVNDAFLKETGYTGEEVIGKTPGVLNTGYHSRIFYNNLYRTLKAGRRWEGRFRNKKKDGSIYLEDAAIFPIELESEIYYCKTAVNVTKQEELLSEKARSLRLASAAQRSLISHDLYHEAVTIAGYYLPLENVSGDIYNIYALEDGLYGVFLADVIGHGIGSALISTSILASASNLIKDNPMPDVFLKGLNETFVEMFKSYDMPQATYFTAAYVLVDTRERKVHYANCGHPKFYRMGKNHVEGLSKVNFSIGMFPDIDYDYDTYTYKSGEKLLVYSDGLVEQGNNFIEGDERLLELLGEYREMEDRGEIIEFLKETMISGHIGGITDDVTMVEMTFL